MRSEIDTLTEIKLCPGMKFLDPLHFHINYLLKERVKYLGPLRASPDGVFEHEGRQDDIGKRGEYSAAVLQRYLSENKTVVVPLPFDNAPQEVPLEHALTNGLTLLV